jgi:hypothetical protein
VIVVLARRSDKRWRATKAGGDPALCPPPPSPCSSRMSAPEGGVSAPTGEKLRASCSPLELDRCEAALHAPMPTT